MNRLLGSLWVLIAVSIGTAQGADLNADQVREILAAAAPDMPADLSGADLTDADLTGADATDADFGRAVLDGARGLDTVKGLTRR